MATATPAMTRTTADAYHLVVPCSPTSTSRTWAWIYLRGMSLVIYSEYGTWGYTWHDTGTETLRQFILRMAATDRGNWEYLLGKLTGNVRRHFDLDATLKQIREWIDDMEAHQRPVRRDHVTTTFTREWARAARAELLVAADLYPSSADAFAAYCIGEPALSWLYQRATDAICVMEADPQCKEFLAVVWPVFVDALKREMEEQKG